MKEVPMAQADLFLVKKISEAGAAEVLNFDWSRAHEPEVFGALRKTFRENPILVIHNSELSPKQLAEFSRQFGDVESNTNRNDLTHPEDPDVLILSNEIRADGSAVGVVDAGEEWHSDLSFQPAPAMATLLQLVKRPSKGGDTAFSNLYLAYEALPDSLKQKVEGRNGIHHRSKLLNPRVSISSNRPGATEYFTRLLNDPAVKHPIVRTHPETGRQALFISPRFTIG